MENIILKGLLSLIFLSIVFLGPALTEWLVKRSRERAIKEGRIRMLSHAEYNRAFGVKNELKRIK